MTAAAEPRLLQGFFNYGNIGIMDKKSKAALRICNKQSKDYVDATITACKVKPYNLPALFNCNWPLVEIKVVARGDDERGMSPASFTSLLFDLFSKFPLLQRFLITATSELEELPENIGELSQLKLLIINEGYKLEVLPPSFTQLSALERLELNSCNQLTFDELVPLQHLAQLTRLEMYGDILHEPLFAEWLCSCDFPLLQHLCLGYGICDFSPSFASFNNLTQLILRFNEDAPEIEVPESISALSSLKKLDLSSEQSISFPDSFSALTTLKDLCISARVNKEDIDRLQYLTGLTGLELSRFCYSVSEDEANSYLDFLCNLTLLKKMNLHESVVRSLPDALGNLKNLEVLDVRTLGYIHTLPETIGNLSSLTRLDITRCKRLLNLPYSIGNLAALKVLSLIQCNLKRLPESIGNLNNLTFFEIEGKEVIQLASSIGSLGSLEHLRVCGGWGSNLDFCELPDSIGNLKGLKVLDVFRWYFLRKLSKHWPC